MNRYDIILGNPSTGPIEDPDEGLRGLRQSDRAYNYVDRMESLGWEPGIIKVNPNSHTVVSAHPALLNRGWILDPSLPEGTVLIWAGRFWWGPLSTTYTEPWPFHGFGSEGIRLTPRGHGSDLMVVSFPLRYVVLSVTLPLEQAVLFADTVKDESWEQAVANYCHAGGGGGLTLLSERKRP